MNYMIWKIFIYVVITIIVTAILAIFQQHVYQIFKVEILNFEKIDGAPIILPQLAPAIAFFIIILFIKSLKIPISYDCNTIIATKAILALIIPPSLIAIAFFISRFVGIETKLTSATMPAISIGIVTILVGALGEEIGWRSFLQPTIEKNVSVLFASIIVGLIWGLWHIGHYKNGTLYMIAFLLFTISASIIIAWILRDTQYNIIISTLFHTSINFAFFIMFKHSLADYKFIIITAIVWMIPALGIILMTGKNL